MAIVGKRGLFLFGATALFLSGHANAWGSPSLSVSARVPTVCEVGLASPALSQFNGGANNLGTLTELCNDVAGYTITLHHPEGLADAWIDLGDRQVPISSTATETVIVDSNEPAYRERPVRLVLAQAPGGPIRLSLDAQPKGTIF
jgi:hypothetical protein